MTFEYASSFLPLTVIYMLITSDMKVTKYIGIYKPSSEASYMYKILRVKHFFSRKYIVYLSTQVFFREWTKALCSGPRPQLTVQDLN